MLSERPRLHLPLSGPDRLLDLSALILLVLFLVLFGMQWQSLPSQVPVHYGFDGNPDRWSGKNTLFLLPALVILLYASLSALARFPHVYNYPWPITAENAERQYVLARRMIHMVKLTLVAIFFSIYVGTLAVVNGAAKGLTPWFLVLTIASTVGSIIWYMVAARRAR